MRKVYVTVIISVLLFCFARASAEPAAIEDIWKHIDGSTACIPLAEAVCEAYSGLDKESARASVEFHTTSYAYDSILRSKSDGISLIFVTPPSASEALSATNEGVKYDYVPIARDALVMINNAENEVSGLSLSQIQGIYSGEITNWSEVGGNDAPILAYQRSRNSGSQTLFEGLVMRDMELVRPSYDMRIGTMGFLVYQIISYDNGPDALGYSMYYYVNNMYGSERLRMLTVDGIAPNYETIANGEYPFCTYYYAVLPSDLPADSWQRSLVKWLVSEEGQRVVANAGYVPLYKTSEPQRSVSNIKMTSEGTGGTEPKNLDDTNLGDIYETNPDNLRLSDVFYDGFDYIEYINWYIITNLDDALYHYAYEYSSDGYEMELATSNGIELYETESDIYEEVFKRAFTGFPPDYTDFYIYSTPYRSRVDLVLMGDDESVPKSIPDPALWGEGETYFCVPLLPSISPYGRTYYEFKRLPYEASFDIFARPILSVNGSSSPLTDKINAAIDEMVQAVVKRGEECLLDNPDEEYLYGLFESVCGFDDEYVYVCFANDFISPLESVIGHDSYVETARIFSLETGDALDLSELYRKLVSSESARFFTDRGIRIERYNNDEDEDEDVSAYTCQPLPDYNPPSDPNVTDAWDYYEYSNRQSVLVLRFEDSSGSWVRMEVPFEEFERILMQN